LSLFCIYCKPIRDTHTKVMELIWRWQTIRKENGIWCSS
jgi:hypothetical protein